MRAFVALELAPEAALALAGVAEELRASPRLPPTRLAWTRAAKMHLTLKFFGEIDVGRVAEIAEILGRLVEGRAPPRVRVKELTAFPSPRHATVVVLEFEGDGLAGLAADAEPAFESIGIAKEQRPFRGHATLARSKTPVDARAWLASVEPVRGEWSATELVLFESRLARGGSIYTPVAKAAFTGA